MVAKRAITHKSCLRVRWLDRCATAVCASGVYFTNYTSNKASSSSSDATEIKIIDTT